MNSASDFQRWLAAAMIAARERAGLDYVDIAGRAHTWPSTVKRWEDRQSWPRDIDAALEAYADAAGLGHPRAMWALAIELWEADDAATQFAREAEQAGQPPDGHDASPEQAPPDEDDADEGR